MECHNMIEINFDTSEETLQYSFVPHLSVAFGRKGISVLSNESNQSSYKPIASLLIFSEGYLSSKKFADAVVKTIQRRDNESYVVSAIFYGVSRSNVFGNGPMKTFGQASQWRNILAEIPSLPGYETSCNQSGYEVVEKIAREVYEKIFPGERIGIYTRMLPDIENLIGKQPWGVRSIGLWGMPGIGKTNLAKAVFDHMSVDYEATCFIQNFHKIFLEKGTYGLLQEHFNSFPTNQILKQRVLVVLDDVQNHLDAESFLGKLAVFSPGSLIIITSRDEQVLSNYGVNQIYKVEGLNQHEAQQLFSWCASGIDLREKNLLTELSMKVIEYANGNPLALTLYGEEMSSNEKPNQKEDSFLKIKQSPPQQIIEAVKSSYYALNENEKNILVYIAFYFIGFSVNSVSELLQDLGFFPSIGIHRLVENSLLTISDNRLEMHSMVQAAVRKIGRWECDKLKISEDHKTSFKCLLGTEDLEAISLDASKLNPYDILSALTDMYNIRFMKIYYSDPDNNRKDLVQSLPYGLRVLDWENYPQQSLPHNYFNTSSLVELNMPYSQLQSLCIGTENLKMLKRINLSHSQKLLEVDELSKASNIEKIDLSGCKNLQTFPAIDQLKKLSDVDLSGCTKLKSLQEFPANITLKYQGASSNKLFENLLKSEPPECHRNVFLKSKSFPSNCQEGIKKQDIGKAPPTFKSMVQAAVRKIGRWECDKLKISEDHKTSFNCLLGTEDLETISLDASKLNPDVILSALTDMYNIRFMKIYYSDPDNNRKDLLQSLPYGLRVLDWENYPLQSLPHNFFNTSNLVELNMPYSQLQSLSIGTENLKMLKRINLCHSQKLLEVDELSKASNIEKIDLSGCKNLQSFPAIDQLKKLSDVDLSGCTKLKSLQEFPANITLKYQGASSNKLFENLLKLECQSYVFLKSKSFPSNRQEGIKKQDIGEAPSTFKTMVCESGLKMARIVQEKLASNIRDFENFKFQDPALWLDNLRSKNLKKDRL